MRLQFLIIFTFLFSFCENNDKRYRTESNSPLNSTTNGIVDPPTPVRDTVITHKFSNSSTPDTFRLVLNNFEFEDTNAIFTIRNGNLIYETKFDPWCLAPYIALEDTSKKYLQKLMVQGFVNFFKEENFLKPAIPDTAKYDPDLSMPDYNEWNLLRQDKKSIGFFFKQLDETHKMIAYLKTQKKVIVYNP